MQQFQYMVVLVGASDLRHIHGNEVDTAHWLAPSLDMVGWLTL
jgi:hypothetical protein